MYCKEVFYEETIIAFGVECAANDLCFLTTDLSNKAKVIKKAFVVSAENKSYQRIKSKITYKVTKADKYLSMDEKGIITIKKGITAGTHIMKVQITSVAKGYDTKSVTKTVKVKVKKPRTNIKFTKTAAADIPNL